jgi:hypothetical protein
VRTKRFRRSGGGSEEEEEGLTPEGAASTTGEVSSGSTILCLSVYVYVCVCVCVCLCVYTVHDPRRAGGSTVGLASEPATLEFWIRFPNERNQGKQGATLS